jgi:hypothetical protein
MHQFADLWPTRCDSITHVPVFDLQGADGLVAVRPAAHGYRSNSIPHRLGNLLISEGETPHALLASTLLLYGERSVPMLRSPPTSLSSSHLYPINFPFGYSASRGTTRCIISYTQHTIRPRCARPNIPGMKCARRRPS